MAGVVFMLCIPTEQHERYLLRKNGTEVTVAEVHTPIFTSCDFIYDGIHPLTDSINEVKIPKGELKNTNKTMYKVIEDILSELNIAHATWLQGPKDNYVQVIFSLDCQDRCDEILSILRENKIGQRLQSVVNVIPSAIHCSGNEDSHGENVESLEGREDIDEKTTLWNRFVSSVRARITVAQIAENVRSRALLTFDFICLILISTLLCAIGLVENNNVYLLSSMVISPMMGPVMAGTFGSVIRDRNLQKIGVQTELIGLSIATLVGFCYGAVICIITDKYGTQDWPTYEITSRGELRSLWVGCLIALLSGAAVALGVLSDNIASLVGVAISTSLMPPAVNAGLLWSMSFVYYLKGTDSTRYASLSFENHYSSNRGIELLSLGAVSMCLTFVNIVCIYLAGILVFKMKEVAPMATRDKAKRQFWKHDIKIARNYNKTLQSDEARNIFAKLSNEVAEFRNQKFGRYTGDNDFFHYSTDLAKENSKIAIQRSEYTWSPCTDSLYKRGYIDQFQDVYPGFFRGTDSGDSISKNLNFQFPNVKSYPRRLSQIFKQNTTNMIDKLDVISEGKTNGAKSEMPTTESEKAHIKSKFIVTPCPYASAPLHQ